MPEVIVNLHMHTRYSDGSGVHRDIARAGIAAEVDAVIVTDHNILVNGFEGYYKEKNKKVLVLIGEEVHDQARDPQKNHLLVFGTERELANFADNPQRLIDHVRESGGLAFLAHPDDPAAPLFKETDISWEDWSVQNYHGIELW
ncbi:MAG: PHP domain-containing protein, partial [Anaerolineales bacterium]|nr:PHP domain-containing protein [Anaerolineales bacterium]